MLTYQWRTGVRMDFYPNTPTTIDELQKFLVSDGVPDMVTYKGSPVLAAAYAHWAHYDQKRKYGGRPYIDHPIRVAARTAMSGKVETLAGISAAFLHDVLEDTPVMYAQLQNEFGEDVAKLVSGLSNVKKTGVSRAEQKALDRERLAVAPDMVKHIKWCDRLDNLWDLKEAPISFRALYYQESKLLAKTLGVQARDVPPHPLLEEPIGILRLDAKTRNSAWLAAGFFNMKAGGETVGDLCECTTDELLRFDGIGPVSLGYIREALAEYGLKLKNDP